MKYKTWKFFSIIMAALIFSLAACSDSSESSKNNGGGEFANPQPDENGAYDFNDFSTKVDNTGEPIDGGELTYGIVNDSPFEGTLNYNFNSGGQDSYILQFLGESLLGVDENFMYDQSGAMTFEYDVDKKTITFTIKDDVKWSDGEPLTADDYKYSYEVIGHPGYDGVRYGSTMTNIKGMEEYHNNVQGSKDEGYQTIKEYREENGDTISGIEVIDDETVKITYKEFSPSLLSGGIWSYAMPKHIFAGMPVDEISSSDEVRKHPVGLGPYKVKEIVTGESVIMSPNEYYWRGEPQLEELTLKMVSPSNVIQELKRGTIDIAEFPNDKYAEYDDMTNVQFLAIPDPSFQFVGFKLGSWDMENGKVATDPNMKMADKALREAMWYAVDIDTLADKFYHGLSWKANTLIPPSHKEFQASDLDVPSYDPDKANALLDDAGYEWAEGDEYRTDKDGNELKITFAAMANDETSEPVAKYFLQSWEDIGLNVELLDGRLQEWNTFYERMGENGEDDMKIDVFLTALQFGTDVDPAGLFGPKSLFNFSRYESEESNALLEDGQSVKSLDKEYRMEVYRDWQELMIEEIPQFPTLYQSRLTAVNRRVTNYDVATGADTYLYELGVTEEAPILEE